MTNPFNIAYKNQLQYHKNSLENNFILIRANLNFHFTLNTIKFIYILQNNKKHPSLLKGQMLFVASIIRDLETRKKVCLLNVVTTSTNFKIT